MQLKFEANFEYNETPDQAWKSIVRQSKATWNLKNQWTGLLIGDVGYGKTEVAMRAAFKAVISDKQGCYPSPNHCFSKTTLLRI